MNLFHQKWLTGETGLQAFPLRNPVFSSKASAQVRRVCGLFRLRTPFLPLKKTGPFKICTFMTDSLLKNCLFVEFFD